MDEGPPDSNPVPPFRARVVQESWNYTPSEAASTVATGSMASKRTSDNEEGADNASSVSMYTYTSGDANQYRKEVEGRSFNVLNDTYALPADDEEWGRLNKQHLAITLALGGLYPAQETVQAVLAPAEGERKKILDLGCGSGVWAIAMAKEFPHAQVIGVDLAPTPVDMETVPNNVMFEIDDISQGLSHYEGMFDVVHARLVSAGLTNFRKSKEDIERCLKPGGLMLWVEVDYHMMAQNMIDYATLPSDGVVDGSWNARLLFELAQAVGLSGRSDLETMRKVLDRGLWDDPLLDPHTCHAASLYVPTSPWVKVAGINQQQRLNHIGLLIRQDCSNGLKAAERLFKKVGYEQATIEQFYKNLDHELENMTQLTWARFMLAWGRRRNSDGAPPLPNAIVSSEMGLEMEPYPFMVHYDTAEEALVDANLRDHRRANIKLPPLPPGIM